MVQSTLGRDFAGCFVLQCPSWKAACNFDALSQSLRIDGPCLHNAMFDLRYASIVLSEISVSLVVTRFVRRHALCKTSLIDVSPLMHSLLGSSADNVGQNPACLWMLSSQAEQIHHPCSKPPCDPTGYPCAQALLDWPCCVHASCTISLLLMLQR